MKSGSRFCLLFLSALLLLSGAFCLAGAQVQPTLDQPSPNITSSSPQTMMSWDDLEQASLVLSQKANELLSSAQDLNSKLEQLQRSLLDSTTLLAQSLDMRKQEALAAQVAVKSALNRSLWWQRSGLVVAGAFGGYLANKWPGSGWGAVAGLVVDAGLEVLGSIRIHL